jgi:predicted ATPase
MPFLSYISSHPVSDGSYLQSIPSLRKGLQLQLKTNVTFFVGENGSGKSTLLEGVAEQCGFSLRRGNRNHNMNTGHRFNGYESALAKYLTVAWSPKRVGDGFFMRAESFFNFASYIDELAVDSPRILQAYGGRSLHEQSHGESCVWLFNKKF